jgi:hypothetical protein
MSACRQCGREVGPLRTEDGLYRRGVDISIMDKTGMFCTMRCAARFGVESAQKKRQLRAKLGGGA